MCPNTVKINDNIFSEVKANTKVSTGPTGERVIPITAIKNVITSLHQGYHYHHCLASSRCRHHQIICHHFRYRLRFDLHLSNFYFRCRSNWPSLPVDPFVAEDFNEDFINASWFGIITPVLVLAYSPKFLVLLRLLPLLLLIAQVSGLGFLRAPCFIRVEPSLYVSLLTFQLCYSCICLFCLQKLLHTSFVAHLEKLELLYSFLKETVSDGNGSVFGISTGTVGSVEIALCPQMQIHSPCNHL